MGVLVYVPPSRLALSWVASHCGIGADILATQRLVGGITACMDCVTVRADHDAQWRVVLRRWTNLEHCTDGVVEREAAALRAVEGRDVVAPRLLGADPTGARAGVPALLMTEVPGKVVLAPPDMNCWLAELADTQARIHAVACTQLVRSDGWFDPQVDLGWFRDVGLRREALAAANAHLDTAQTVFVHGDYQHFNVLWTATKLSGVVDWTMAGIGPRGTDVGHCRLNLAVLFSADAADAYLHHYEKAAGLTVDPHADLRALLCWAPDWQDFIPTQIAGRTQLDLHGMPERIVETVRRALARLG